ncbi:hypothetical protein PRVXT_000251 [Proteinivorax tanatarense]|uniref:Uncharacterized protein n=1 Tax=Proteinivorax tanatarense TaxID=1260629 RepID=A0AAU7VM43_9FIRM
MARTRGSKITPAQTSWMNTITFITYEEAGHILATDWDSDITK